MGSVVEDQETRDRCSDPLNSQVGVRTPNINGGVQAPVSGLGPEYCREGSRAECHYTPLDPRLTSSETKGRTNFPTQ